MIRALVFLLSDSIKNGGITLVPFQELWRLEVSVLKEIVWQRL
jgi:hypothetical protein